MVESPSLHVVVAVASVGVDTALVLLPPGHNAVSAESCLVVIAPEGVAEGDAEVSTALALEAVLGGGVLLLDFLGVPAVPVIAPLDVLGVVVPVPVPSLDILGVPIKVPTLNILGVPIKVPTIDILGVPIVNVVPINLLDLHVPVRIAPS